MAKDKGVNDAIPSSFALIFFLNSPNCGSQTKADR